MRGASHVPVLKAETLGYLQPAPGKRILDGTFGFGGHSQACLDAGAEVLGLDLDSGAFTVCQQISADNKQLLCRQISFRHFDRALDDAGWERVDGVLLDLGVNSRQLDEPGQGFSYRTDGPLDLRFNQEEGESAAEFLASVDEKELADVIWRFGEERSSRRIARALVKARESERITTTTQLADIVKRVLPGGVKPMPALSRVFQALRIAVNDELAALEETLEKLPRRLGPGGRFVIISYHSLEDRLVKRFVDRERRDCLCPPELPACVCGHRAVLKPLTRGAVKASTAELESNPRSRSARLRAAERI